MRIARVDYLAPRDAQALVLLLDAYARDPMGGGEPLSVGSDGRNPVEPVGGVPFVDDVENLVDETIETDKCGQLGNLGGLLGEGTGNLGTKFGGINHRGNG